MRPYSKNLGWVGVCLLALLTGCRGLENGNMAWVQPESDQPHAGNVYLVRGLIGVFSTGMDDLSIKLNRAGVRARVYQDAQHSVLADQIVAGYKGAKNPEPLVLIGHSYGADDVVTIANVLDKNGIKVDLLVTIDATVPPKVPANVAVCYNYFQSNATDVIPMFRGIPLERNPGATGKLYNIDVRKNGKELLEPGTNHINIDKNPLVHAVVIKEVLDICPARPAWVAAHRPNSPSAQAQQASQTIAPSNQRVASQVGRAN